MVLIALLLERGDVGLVRQSERDVIVAVDHALLTEWVDFELELVAADAHGLIRQVDLEIFVGIRSFVASLRLILGQLDRQQAVLLAVVRAVGVSSPR